MGIWEVIRGKKKGTGRASQHAFTGLEQLEPRLLLNADLVGLEPSLTSSDASIDQVIEASLGEVALFGATDTSIDKDVTVTDGLVVSNGDISVDKNAQIEGVLGGDDLSVDQCTTIDGAIVVNDDAMIKQDVIVEGDIDADGVSIGRDAFVDGRVTADGLIVVWPDATVTGGIEPFDHPRVFSLLDLPVATEFEANPELDVQTQIGQETTLAPGAYGDLHLGVDNTLNLSSGEYYLEGILTGGGLDLNLDLTSGEIAVYVLGNVDFGGGLEVFVDGTNIAEGVDSEWAGDVYIETHGEWRLHDDGQWFGTIFAPDGDVVLHNGSLLVGAAYSGGHLRVKKDAVVKFVPSHHWDNSPPVVEAALVNDTGRADWPGSDDDHITSDPTISGTITDESDLASVRIALDPVLSTPIEILGDSFLGPDGSFTFDRPFFESLLGGPLADGDYVLRIWAEDEHGNVSEPFELAFTLSTEPPTVEFGLAETSDSEPLDDDRTTFDVVTLAGSTDPHTSVTLFASDDLSSPLATGMSDATGYFTLTDVPLTIGPNAFTVVAVNLAGNEGSSERTITRDVARLLEGTNFEVSYEQTITVPSEPSHLSISYDFLFFDETTDFINDAFEVALLDSSGQTFVHTIASDRDAAFNSTEGQAPKLGANTHHDGSTIQIDLTHIPAGTAATLVLRLVNNDSDTTSTVTITAIEVVPGSLGTPLGISYAGAASMAGQPIDFDHLQDVTEALSPEYGTTSFNDDTSVLYADLDLHNISSFVVDGPLIAVIDHLSDPQVQLLNADGVTPEGLPYVDLTPYLSEGSLAPDARTTLGQVLAFLNPTGTQFTYDLVLLGYLNAAPEFVSKPDTEALPGKPYSYTAQAVDPNGDTLAYSLIMAPTGMVIDQVSGEIAWTPADGEADLGTYDILVEAQDGRGGAAQQRYILNVIAPPPNRPPVFTSVPVTEAELGAIAGTEAIPVDLASWAVQNIHSGSQPNASWSLEQNNTLARQSVNADASVLLSDFDSVGLRLQGEWYVDSGGDDDYIGFVFGWQDTGHFYLFDWKRSDQNDPAGFAEQGMSVRVVSADSILTDRDLWPTSGNGDRVRVLYHNRVPWHRLTTYTFSLDFTAGLFTIRVGQGDDLLAEITVVDSTYADGQFGFYNYSQENVVYSGFTQEAIPEITYHYDADAVDPDQDAVDYSLVQGPDGMAINETTGEVLWGPTVDQIGEHEVTIMADDGRGGIAEQTYIVTVLGDPNNHAPVIVSEPLTTYVTSELGTIIDTTIRDFNSSHPDFESYLSGVVRGLVESTLGPDGNPVFRRSGGAITSADTFNQWYNDVPGVNLPTTKPLYLTETSPGSGIYTYNSGSFFPIDGQLFGNQGRSHNYHFTLEAHTAFEYQGGEVFTFRGDDDLWVFINGQLAIDLGGVHGAASQSVALDSLGLVPGEVYSFDLFFAERHTSASSFRIETTLVLDSSERYLYDVAAVDSDFDDLRYSLSECPDGMRIDPVSGIVSWSATQNDIGEHEIIVRVEDGRGGFDEQSYILEVLAAGDSEIHGTKFHDLDHNGTSVTSYTYEDGDFDPSEWEYQYIQVDGTGSTGTITYGESGGNPGTYNVHTHVIYCNQQDTIHTVALSPYSYDPSVLGKIDSLSMAIDLLEDPAVAGVTGAELVLEQDGILYYSRHFAFSEGYWTRHSLSDLTAEDFDSNPDGYVSHDGDHPDFSQNGSPLRLGYGLWNWGWGGGYLTLLHFADNWSVTVTPTEESGLAGWTIYLDQNQNGRIDQGEPWTSTDEDGQYSFTGLPDREYHVAEVPQQGWQQTAPVEGYHVVTMADGQIVHNVDFGNVEADTTINDYPYFTTDPIIEGTPWTKYLYRAHAADPENDPLTYDLPVAPEGMAVHPELGVVAWIPTADQIGTHQVILRAQDGNGGVALQLWQIEVTAANIPPVIVSTPIIVAVADLPYEYQVQAQDADGETITYGLAKAPDGMTIDPDTGLVSWTASADQIGSHEVIVSATDERDATTLQAYDLDAVATAPNDAPVITSTPRSRVRLGNTYGYLVQASDPNGDPVSFSLLAAPEGMTIDPEHGAVLWTPTADQFGPQPVHIQVSDGRGGIAEQSFTIEVNASDSNADPVITSNPRLSAVVDKIYAYDLTVEDPDGDPVNWSLVEAPTGMSIHPEKGTLRWTPTIDQLGSQMVTVQATDPFGATAQQSFRITVRSTNLAPLIASTPPTQATADEPYSYAVIAEDIEGDRLAFSLTQAPEAMTIDPETGLIEWTPSTVDVGEHTVSILVDDGNGGQVSQAYTLVVAAEAINQAPAITSTPQLYAKEQAAHVYQVTAVDPEGEPVEFYLLEAPTGMTIGRDTGQIEWLPAADQNGPHTVRIAAIDPQGAGGQQQYTLTVRANQAPTIVSTPKDTAAVGATYRYQVLVDDPDDTQFTYALTVAPAGMTIDPLGRVQWPTTLADQGDHAVTIEVADPFGATAQQSFTLNVAQDTTAPVVTLAASDSLADPGDSITFQVRATDDVGIASVVLLIDGEIHTLESDGSQYRANITFDTPGLYDVVARATDVSGNEGFSETHQVRVFDPADNAHPVVTIHSPEYQGMVTYLTDVVLSVQDDNLAYWKIEYAPANKVDISQLGADDPDYILLAEGTEPLDHQVATVLDPTLLANDAYIMRVTAYDLNGSGWVEPLPFGISGNAKLGNFTFTVADVSIPLVGIPITINRTYDTLQAANQDDFGYGWTLGFADANIGETTPANQEMQPGDRVYLTTPDGRRIGFTYEPRLEHLASLIGYLGTTYYPAFTPDPGVYETLTVQEGSYMRGGLFGSVSDALDGYWNPAQYVLTMRDGTTYEYIQNQGLQKITDLNGNVVTFTDAAIIHSSGQQIELIRDPQGRIVEIVDPAGNSVRYSYDAAGDLVGFTNQVDETTTYEYLVDPAHFLDAIYDATGTRIFKAEFDEDGRLASATDALGNVTQQDFDTAAMMGTITSARGNITELYYDERGNVTREVDPLGGVTVYAYEDPDNPDKETSITDPNGNTTTYSYDSRGNKLTETDALGNTTTYTYDTDDNVTSVTDALGHQTVYQYDTQDNLAQMTNAAGNSMVLTYDDQGRLISTTDFNGNTTQYEYDGTGNNPNRVINPDGTVKHFEYNGYGQATRQTNEINHDTWFDYDNLGRLIAQRDHAGNETTRDYDAAGNLIKITDPLGNETLYEYNEAGNLIQETNAEDGIVTYTYDAEGNRLSLTDPVGNTTTWVYDANNQMIEEIDPLGSSRFYDYDAAGNLIEMTDRLERRTEYDYDAANRLIEETWYSDTGDVVSTITSTYDAVGNLLTIVDDYSAYAYTYDILNRVTSEDNAGSPDMPHVILYHEYDANGNDIRTWDSDGVEVGSIYDSRSRLITRTWQGPDIDEARIDFQYCWCNVLIGIDRYSDLEGTNLVATTDYAFDESGRYTEITHRDASDNILAQYLYDYDAAGRLIWDSIDGATAVYTYDKTGQLLTVTRTGSTLPDEYYVYDANGNRIESYLHGDAYVTGPGNHLLTDGDFNYEYDAEGNMIRKTEIASGNTTGYVYDHRNRMVKATELSAGGVILSGSDYVHDAQGRRIAIITDGVRVSIVYNGENAWADYETAGGAVVRYLFGNRIDEIYARHRSVEGLLWHVTDKLGSVRSLVDANGDILALVSYSAFGSPAQMSNQQVLGRYLFTGREYDNSLRMYYYRARFFDSRSGRFASADPMGFSAGDSNIYRYVGNSPANGIDPTGTNVMVGELTLETEIELPTIPVLRLLGIAIACGILRVATEIAPVSFSVPEPFDLCVVSSDCKKASAYQLSAAGIHDPHAFKQEWGAVPWSHFDICACKDGSIWIAAVGMCGKSGPKIPTDAQWK